MAQVTRLSAKKQMVELIAREDSGQVKFQGKQTGQVWIASRMSLSGPYMPKFLGSYN